MAEVPCTRVIETGLGALMSVAWSPDGGRLAVGDGARGVSVWGLDGRRWWHRVEHARPGTTKNTHCVAWSPDGRTLASGGGDGGLILWSSADGQVRLRRPGRHIVRWLAWSPDGRRLAQATAPEAHRNAQIVDPETGAVGHDLTGHTDWVNALAWSPDGRILATASDDRTVRLWDPRDARALATLAGHEGKIWGLSWSPDGRRLASGAEDKALRIWDPANGNCLNRIEVAKPIAQSIAWSPDGRLIAAGCGYKGQIMGTQEGAEIRLWCPDTGRELACLEGHGDEVMCTAFAPDAPRLASVSRDGSIRLWDCSALVPRTAVPVVGAAYLARQAATLGRRPVPGAARPPPWVPTGLTRPADGTGKHCLGCFETPSGDMSPSLALSPDGRRLATGSGDGLVRLWDLTAVQVGTASPIWVGGEHHENGFPDVAFSPDGRRLASAGADRICRLWDSATGQLLGQLTVHTGAIYQAAWSPDGRRLATASEDRTVRLWDPDRLTCLRTLGGHEGIVHTVAWSPDGRLLASGGDDRIIRLWDPASGQALRRLAGHQGTIVGIAFSPDGQVLASASTSQEKEIRLWDPRDGRLLHRWPSHEHCEYATQVVWSPDGRLLASAPLRREQTGLQPEVGVRIWGAATGTLSACFPFPEKYCLRLAWSPDGAFLATSHTNITALASDPKKRDIFRLWDTRPLLPQSSPAPTLAAPTGPLPADLAALPDLAAALARLGRHPPLSLLRDLEQLLGTGRADGPLAPLAEHKGVRALRTLRWPRRTHPGLLALLLREVPFPDWAPPPGLGPTALGEGLRRALAGPPCPPEPPTPPIPLLERAAARIDDRLLALLTLLGPDAVATDPALPLQLAHRVPLLPPMSTAQRRLLGLRLRLDAGGPVQGSGIGVGSVGITNQGDLRALLPS